MDFESKLVDIIKEHDKTAKKGPVDENTLKEIFGPIQVKEARIKESGFVVYFPAPDLTAVFGNFPHENNYLFQYSSESHRPSPSENNGFIKAEFRLKKKIEEIIFHFHPPLRLPSGDGKGFSTEGASEMSKYGIRYDLVPGKKIILSIYFQPSVPKRGMLDRFLDEVQYSGLDKLVL